MQCFLTKNKYMQLHNTIHKRIKTLGKHVTTIPYTDILDSLGFTMDWYNAEKLSQ